MRSVRPVALGLALLLPAAASGVVLTFLDDPQKEKGVAAALDDPKVKALRTEFDALAHRMSFWKARDFEALFGPPIRPVHTDYALTCTQSRLITTSGVGVAGEASKAHTDAYAVGDGLRADVRFQRDGVTPDYVLFYLRTGDGFVRLDRAEQLEARVIWERAVLWKALKHVDARWRAVVGWEVDPAAFDKLFAGREAADPDEKFRAYSEWGKDQGLQLYQGHGHWEWYRGETRVAQAYGNGDERPANFILSDGAGRSVREHMGGGPRSYSIRWNRADGSSTRFESWERDGDRGPWRATGWGWSGPGGRGGRSEKDTNGDGIPDEVWESVGGKEPAPAPLAVERSWAVHPELIPADMRIADRPDRRLPVRKIAK